MKTVKAKVLGTGKKITAMELLDKEGVYIDTCSGVEYKREEIEIIEDVPEEMMPFSSKHDLPDMERLFAQVLDRQLNTFWRDKRVEIVEKLLQRDDCSIENVVEKADSIIQQLKTLGD